MKLLKLPWSIPNEENVFMLLNSLIKLCICMVHLVDYKLTLSIEHDLGWWWHQKFNLMVRGKE